MLLGNGIQYTLVFSQFPIQKEYFFDLMIIRLFQP